MQWFPGDRIAQVACFGSGNRVDPSLHQEDTTVTMCQLASGKLARIRIDALSPRPHQMAYYTIQGTKGAVECSRVHGEGAKIWLEGMDAAVDEAKWRPLSDLREHLPQRYLEASEQQRTSGHGGGDFFIVEDFVNAVRGLGENPVDVYTACEWTAVGILSRLSIMNGSRMIDVPHFRKNMPRAEQRVLL
jgi:predicted dehydrogenase